MSDSLVSAEHAVLYWEDGLWHVRDLASRNGTFVNDRSLQRGHSIRLEVGDRLSFGETSRYWTLTEASAPEPCAYEERNGAQCVGHGGLLILPDENDPEVSVYASAATWMAEHGEAVRQVENGDRLTLGGGAWILFLPPAGKGSLGVTQDAWLDVDKLTLDFFINANEEHVEVTLRQHEVVRSLPPRAFLYTLLQLARERTGTSELDPDAGWVDADQLSRKLACSREKLNVDVHRIRRLAESVGVRDAGRLIERRADSRQIRLGPTKINIQRF